MISAPVLMITVGDFATDLLVGARTLSFHDDPRRLAMAGLYRVMPVGKELEFKPIGQEQAQALLSLESVLHDLRLHETFLQASLSDEQELSLGIIVLVDLTEKNSELLHPLLGALLEKMAHEPGSYLYLLCKSAIFEAGPAKRLMQARIHLHLSKLKTFAEEAGTRFQVYLFDRFKEGLLEARDAGEIGLLMQNFLLASLSSCLGQKLAHDYSLGAEDQADIFYHSAGATALLYDPSMLQKICADRLASRVLELEFLSEGQVNPVEAQKAADTFLGNLRQERDWIEQLCADTPYRIKSVELLGLDLHFSDLQFEDLPPQEWGDAIVGYASYFEKNLQAAFLAILAKNSEALSVAVLNDLKIQLAALPVHSDLYPGMIVAGLQILQQCAETIHQRMQSWPPVQNEEETASLLEAEFQSAMRQLDAAIDALPEPPRWVKRLPGKLHTYAQMLLESIFLHREHGQLIMRREKIVQALERKYAFQFEQQMRRLVIELFDQVLASLEKARSDLESLRSKFRNLKRSIEAQDPPSQMPTSPFRRILLNPGMVEWAYAQGRNDSSSIRAGLLEHNYLKEWREVSEESLKNELVAACMGSFEFLDDFSAEELLKRAEPDDISSLVALLAQGSTPALRPDFDLAGGNTSHIANYFLCADTRSSDLARLLDTSRHEWQKIETGDPYTILFCRVRQMISVNALSFLMQSARAAFESLSEQEQKDLQEVFERDHP